MSEQILNGFKHALTNDTTKANTAFKNELLEKLPQFFTSDGDFDIEKFRENLALSNVNEIRDGYTLNYVGKIYARLQTGQPTKTVIIPDQKHNKLPENGDSKNVFLTGDNLDVLKHLQKAYTNSIDFIYIDPPYNTGSDGFVYNDTFSLSDDDLRDTLNFTDDEINRLKILNGRSSHSAWLTFMYPRLKIAQQLLKDTGVIFVSIDDNEQANLKLLMDDIFGESNFTTQIAWKRKKEISNDSQNVSIQGEYIFVYTKTCLGALKFEPLSEVYIEKSYKEPNENFTLGKWRPVPITVSKGLSGGGYDYEITTPNGTVHRRIWAYPEKSYLKLLEERRIYFGKDNGGIPQRVIYAFESKGQPTSNYWNDVASNKDGKKELMDLLGTNVFDTVKPIKLIQKALQLATEKESIVLDFFAGSGTTADAVMQLNAEDGGNRQFILATLDEDAKSDVAKSAGFNTIDDISRERIKRAAAKIKSKNPDWHGDCGFKHFYVKEMEAQTMDKIIEFDPTITQLLPDDMVSEFARPDLEATGTDTILQTWLINDGYKLDTKIDKVNFNQNSGYHIDNRLYIIEEFTQNDVKVLLNKIGNSEINISTIIVFGYSISSDTSSYFTTMTGLKNNIKTNLDGVKVEVRY